MSGAGTVCSIVVGEGWHCGLAESAVYPRPEVCPPPLPDPGGGWS